MKMLLPLLLIAIAACNAPAEESVQLTTANTVTLRGVIDDASTSTAALNLIDLVEKRGSKSYPIYLVLDSPGGGIAAGEDFIEFVKTIPNVKTITIFAASMASAIVEALPGERLAVSNGTLMFHRATGQVGGQFETGELESRLAYYKSIVLSMETRNATRMGITSIQMYKNMVKDELWLYGKQMVGYGGADKIVDVKCSKQLIEQVVTQDINFMMFTIKLKFSGCPLLKNLVPDKDNSEDNLAKWKAYKESQAPRNHAL